MIAMIVLVIPADGVIVSFKMEVRHCVISLLSYTTPCEIWNIQIRKDRRHVGHVAAQRLIIQLSEHSNAPLDPVSLWQVGGHVDVAYKVARMSRGGQHTPIMSRNNFT